MKPGIVLLFPGIRYSCDMPLLYYPAMKYSAAGYEIVKVDYGPAFANVTSWKKSEVGDSIRMAESCCIGALRKIPWAEYEQVIFVSKSMGTAVAGQAAEELGLEPVQYYLTPVVQTLPYLVSGHRIGAVVAGSADNVMDHAELEAHCRKQGIPLTTIPDVAHRLEVKGDPEKSLEIVKVVMRLFTMPAGEEAHE